MATVEIDVDEHLSEASDWALAKEVKRRIARGNIKPVDVLPKPDDIEAWCRVGMADDIRTAFYARNAARLEALLAALERMEGEG